MSEKIAFLTTAIGLTPGEAQAFWPVYNQMWEERGKAQFNVMKAYKALEAAVDGNKTIPADVLARVLSQKLAAENLAKDREERIRIETALAMRPPFRQRAVIGGDALVPAISAASIVAKVYRDAFMDEMDRAYPGYGFAAHKGYGTKEHLKALQELGPCPLHRLSFKGVPKGVSRTKSS